MKIIANKWNAFTKTNSAKHLIRIKRCGNYFKSLLTNVYSVIINYYSKHNLLQINILLFYLLSICL
jgi:hypothetical protein